MPPQIHYLCHRRQTYHEASNAVLGYVSTSAGANIKVVELVAEHSNMYNWKYCSYTSKDVVDLVWRNIGKGLNK